MLSIFGAIRIRKLYYIRRWQFALLNFVILLQIWMFSGTKVFGIISISNFNFWYSSIITLILWNFAYFALIKIFTKAVDELFLPKLFSSLVYHMILVLATILISLS
jgi:cell shape-determining protein MreD